MKIGIDGTILYRTMTGSERYIHNIFTTLCAVSPENQYAIYTKCPIYHSEPLPQNATERTFAKKSDMVATDFLCGVGSAVDLYHMTWFAGYYVDLLPLYLTPASVLTVLDLMLFRYHSYFPSRALHDKYQRRCRLAIDMADLIIAISSHTKSDILANFDVDPEKVKVVLIGVDDGFYRPTEKEVVDRIKARHGVNKPFLFYVGTDYPHKNHKNLILAFHHLVKEKKLSAQLVLAGARYYFRDIEYLQELASSLQLDRDLIWLEHVDDEELKALYKGAHLFVYPSLDEGFGLPLLEAMACGTPVAASKAASIPEVAGDAAVFFDPTDVRDMANAIEKVWKDQSLRCELVERGRKRCAELSWTKTAEQTLAVYKEAIGRGKMPLERSRDKIFKHHRAMLNGIMEDFEMSEQNSIDLTRAVEHLTDVAELKEKRLQMILGSRSLRYYRKIRGIFRKSVGS